MLDVINLALPFFGVMFLGYACGKFRSTPYAGLAWMNFFVVYIALPAMFYRILARTPLEQVVNLPFILATLLATGLTFALAFAITFLVRRGNIPEATIAGLAGGYGNVGYMGPGLAIATLGQEAAVPVALIFCFDNMLLFTLVPVLMAAASDRRRGVLATTREIVGRIFLNPFILATGAGVLGAAFEIRLPVAIDGLLEFLQNAAAPCALFTLGVTVALRPLDRIPWEVPLIIPAKLIVHPVLALCFLSLLGPQPVLWVYTAVLLAALPPALNVFIIARHYDIWVAQASSAVLLGTAVSVFTLTGVMWLVRSNLLPHSLF